MPLIGKSPLKYSLESSPDTKPFFTPTHYTFRKRDNPTITSRVYLSNARRLVAKRKEVIFMRNKQQYKKLMSYSKSELIAIIKNDDYIIDELNKKLKEGR